MQELDEISHWVRTQAVPRLVTGLEPPEPPLPTRYEITVGHEDEYRAMAAGSRTSAADRHKQRLAAATARIGLVETIALVEGSPSVPEISAWLAQLTDVQVLDRQSRLQVTHTYDLDVMHRNLEVLERMRDEAVKFTRDGATTPNGVE